MNPEQRPTSVRYLIVAAATLMSFLLYLDRFCVSFAGDYIKQDLGLTQTQMSWFISGFFWSYALAQVPAGWLSDRYGARIVLTLYIITWSIFTAVIGAANGFALLILARFGCGLGQAGAYPTAASVVARWMPMSARGLASSFVGNGGRVGAAIAPVLTAYLLVTFVPMSTPVIIQPEDIVNPYDAARQLAKRLVVSKPLMVGNNSRKHWSELVPAEQKLSAREVCWDLVDIPESKPNSTEDAWATERASRQKVVSDLLRSIMDSDVLMMAAEQDKRLTLPRESINTLAKLRDRESISDIERSRLKRMTLEALFPNEVKKLYRLGWRPVLVIYGLSGVLVAGFFWLVFRERPELHPRVNAVEAEMIQRGKPVAVAQKLDGIPFVTLITSVNLWANSLMQFGTNVGWLFIFTWLPRYLLEERQVPIIERSYMTMLPVLMGVVGGYLGGKLTDIWATRFGVLWGRRFPILASRVLAIGGYCGCILVSFLPADHALNTAWTVTLLCGVAAFATDFGAPPTWAFAQDIGGRHIASVLGWGNMWGNIGAAVGPLIYDFVLGESPTTAHWNRMFGVCAAAFVLSGFCAFIMDATKPLFRDDQ